MKKYIKFINFVLFLLVGRVLVAVVLSGVRHARFGSSIDKFTAFLSLLLLLLRIAYFVLIMFFLYLTKSVSKKAVLMHRKKKANFITSLAVQRKHLDIFFRKGQK